MTQEKNLYAQLTPADKTLVDDYIAKQMVLRRQQLPAEQRMPTPEQERAYLQEYWSQPGLLSQIRQSAKYGYNR